MGKSSSHGKDDSNWSELIGIWSQLIVFASPMVHYDSKNIQSVEKGPHCPFLPTFSEGPWQGWNVSSGATQ